MGFNFAVNLALRFGPYLAVVLALLWIFNQGRAAERQATALKTAQATIEVLEESTRRNEQAAFAATQAANRRAVNERSLQQKVDAYEDELKNKVKPECLLDDDDVIRLRDLQ